MIKKYFFAIFSLSYLLSPTISWADCSDCNGANQYCSTGAWGADTCVTCTGEYPNADKNKKDCYKITQLKKIYQKTPESFVCVDYATSSNGNCTCSANYTANNGNTACDPKVYKLTLHPNCKNSTQSVCLLTAKKTGYVQYNVGYSLNPKGPFDSETAMPFGTRNNFTFGGYYTTENLVYGTQVFNADGTATVDPTYFKNPTDLYAKWIPNFSILYSVTKGNDVLCSIDVDCANNGCASGAIQIRQLTGCNLEYYFPAQTFSHWICNSKEVHPGDSIDTFVTDANPDSNQIFCIAHFIKCPAGYYCQSNKKNPCPAGTTSAEGSSEITECFVNRATVFKDNVGSFSLPNVKIYYKK